MRSVRWLAFGQGISQFGEQAAVLAMVSLLYVKTGSALWISAAFIVYMLASAASAPIAGYLGDKISRPKLMRISELLGALAFTILVLFPTPIMIIIVEAFAAAFAAPLIPAAMAMLPNMVDKKDLSKATSAYLSGSRIGAMSGPLVAGLMLTVVSPSIIFAANVVCYLVFTLVITLLWSKLPHEIVHEEDHDHSFHAGWKQIKTQGYLKILLLMGGVIVIAHGFSSIIRKPLTVELGYADWTFGLLSTVAGVGILVGMRFMSRKPNVLKGLSLLMISQIIVAFSMIIMGVIPYLPVVLLAATIFGLAEGMALVRRDTMIQEFTKDGVRARVMSVFQMVNQVATGCSFLIGGLLIDLQSARFTLWSMGIIILVFLLIICVQVKKQDLPEGISL